MLNAPFITRNNPQKYDYYVQVEWNFTFVKKIALLKYNVPDVILTLKTYVHNRHKDITVIIYEYCRTPLGKARAWLRLSLMQKSLADYLKVLCERRDQVLG